MALPTNENWDGVTAPARPTGWTYSDVAWVTETAAFQSSPNGLKVPANAATTYQAMFSTADDNAGNVNVKCTVHIQSGNSNGNVVRVLARANDPTTITATYQLLFFTGATGSLQLHGASGQIGSTLNLPAAVTGEDEWFIPEIECNGTSIICRLKRVVDGKYLKSDSTFATGVQDAISATNSGITGAGYYGILQYRDVGGSGNTFWDDFSATAVGLGPATAFTLTGPTRGPAAAISANYTVTPNGTTTATWTPNAQSGCTFTPATLTLAGTTPQTFTVTRSTAGSSTINGTASGLTPPSSISYEAVATTTGNFAYQDGAAATATDYQVMNDDNTGFQNEASAGTSSALGSGSVAGVLIPADYEGRIEFRQGSLIATDVLTPPGGAANPLNGMIVTRG